MAILQGYSSGNQAEVDLNHNLKVNLPTGNSSTVGYVSAVFENDNGSLYGSKTVTSPYVSLWEKRLYVGLDTPMLDYTFNASAQDTGVWKYVTATMTTTWSTTGMLLNANSDITSAHGTAVSTWKSFPLTSDGALEIIANLSITAAPLANEVLEFGIFPFGAGTAAPTEGVYFRFSTSGLIGVTNFNGVETTTSIMLSSSSLLINDTYAFKIHVAENVVSFWLDNAILVNGILNTEGAHGQPFITTSLPMTFQYRNSGTVAGSPVMQVKVTDAVVENKTIPLNKAYPHIQASKGLMGYQGSNGGTMGSTALYTNSLAAGAGVVMTNTTAALGVGLGGQFTTQPTLAVGTDGIVSSYQVPIGSVNQTPRVLYVTGVKIQGVVTTLLTGGTVIYAYSLAFGHSAVSLATAEAVAAKAPRRIPLGIESFAANSKTGVVGSPNGVYMQFTSPIVVNPGEFIAITAKNIGLVTTSGVITFLVAFDSYLE